MPPFRAPPLSCPLFYPIGGRDGDRAACYAGKITAKSLGQWRVAQRGELAPGVRGHHITDVELLAHGRVRISSRRCVRT